MGNPVNKTFWIKLCYNLLFAVFFAVVSLPYLYKTIRRGRSGRGLLQKFGLLGPATLKRVLNARGGVWIHAVSVGEVNLATLVIREARRRWPELPILLTTTTPTGREVALRQVPDDVQVIYNPLDFLPSVRWTFMALQPRVLVLIESEIWPNYMWEAQRRSVPVVMVNARLSQRTERRYKACNWFVLPFLQQLSLVCAQNAKDLARYQALGAPPNHLVNTGSMKYDVCKVRASGHADPREILRVAGWKDGQPILLAGSTHAGEEKMIAAMWQQMVQENPEKLGDVYLVLAPRHAERGSEISQQLRKMGIQHKRRSKLKEPSQSNRVLVLDSTGELRGFYGLATVTFVGKSVLGKGGQNFLEPVQAMSPVVFGPYMANFEPMAGEFALGGAVLRATDKIQLNSALKKLLSDPSLRQVLAHRARDLYESKLGATAKTVDALADYLTRTIELPEQRDQRMKNPSDTTDLTGMLDEV